MIICFQLFEKKISNYVGAKKTIVCNSGTAALHISFRSINLKEKDVVLMPAINFISSYSMAKQFKARIFLCDVDKYTGLITPEMSDIIEYCEDNGLFLLTDDAHSFGAQLYDEYKDKGLVVLGLPSNDFMNQEPGSELEIAQFCKLTYDVSFPMTEKVKDVPSVPTPAPATSETLAAAL